MKRRRASTRITLVLIGTAALAACDEPTTKMARDHYATAEDCAADWGRPESCDRVQSSGYPGGAFVFRGPPYAVGARESARALALGEAGRGGSTAPIDPTRQGRAIGTAIEPTARGGFGANSRSYSSSGS